jgi:GTPase SAR1 family protein
VTDEDSFESLNYWVGQLRDNSSQDIQICLMANKIDLVQEGKAKLAVTSE